MSSIPWTSRTIQTRAVPKRTTWTLRLIACLPVLLMGTFSWAAAPQAAAQPAPRIESFSPEGTVKGVRQVRVTFTAQMVPFGDPRAVDDPFEISCGVAGKGRWADARNWLYDFESDLPAGVSCTFTLRSGLRALDGSELSGRSRFTFSTGGPAILGSEPWEGNEGIDEEQIFILELDAEPAPSSVLENAWFSIQGIEERVGVRIVSGSERDRILESTYRYRENQDRPLILLQAKRRFPNEARVDLVWGSGIASASGIGTESQQVLPFRTRPAFVATFGCSRENAEADCIPIRRMYLSFSSPVPWNKARQIALTGPNGRRWTPEASESEEDARKDRHVGEVIFKEPFPPEAEFKLQMPSGVEDDAGRKLSNANQFPLTIRTDHYPPLAKFAADFGILEWKASPVLPVTMRGLEPEVAGSQSRVQGETGGEGPVAVAPIQPGVATMPGTVLRIPSGEIGQILFWLTRIHRRVWDDREKSIFDSVAGVTTAPLRVPKPNGGRAFEVVGIPLPDPGFYVVELQSELLGAALLGKPAPMFVPTTALVTNLGVHFKWGIESSLVWVTTLDEAKPVPAATVEICDCSGMTLWKGNTDSRGLALIPRLAPPEKAKDCSEQQGYGPYSRGVTVVARSGPDMSFVHSSSNQGIEPWRFGVPTEYDDSLITARTVLDRSLLRAGETVHLKHVLRRRVTGGFSQLAEAEKPASVFIRHGGSNQEFELPVKWDAQGLAENEWQIPRDARLGFYEVLFKQKGQNEQDYEQTWTAADFRVEEYRVPLLRASLQFPSQTLIGPAEVPVDVNVRYLAGGGAGRLPVRLRYQVSPGASAIFEDFESFVFGNGRVKEGIDRHDRQSYEEKPPALERVDLVLDQSGGGRATLSGLPAVDDPSQLRAELDFRDPNGETQTVSATARLWPAALLVGLKAESWVLVKDELKFQAAVVDLAGQPLANRKVRVDLYERKHYSHRKRLVGGFYAYENYTETKRVSTACEGRTDATGLLECSVRPSAGGEMVLQARASDDEGRDSFANRGFWSTSRERWWFAMEDHDRMDVIPEKKSYEPGEIARFQVRMPFETATALICVEREGIGETFLQALSGSAPVIELPVSGTYGPNVYVSVLAVRGRAAGPAPTAMIDLAKPAYKLGVAEIQVGWKAYELKVKVTADREVYRVREKATVRVSVSSPTGRALPAGAEIALAAVDEGLLELRENDTWPLLARMMGRRGHGVRTSTAQMHLVGKRHFGLKALPSGGDGGRQATREMFDTLLIWKGRVPLDSAGNAVLEVPLNDSVTSFRIVAVATAGTNRFGFGSTSIRSIQELTLFSGIAPVVRGGDRVVSAFTVRNTTDQPLPVDVTPRIREIRDRIAPVSVNLQPGEARDLTWDVAVPPGASVLHYEVEARSGSFSDRIAVTQRVVEAVPVRVVQATLFQLENESRQAVEKPGDALPGRGGVQVAFRPTLLTGLEGVRRYMGRFPYTCLEQKVSRAVALKDEALWNAVARQFESHLDADGLLKYFPSMRWGSEVLTAYVLSIAHEAGWPVGPAAERMQAGLQGFIEGRVVRWSSLPTADLALRKMGAVEALSRYETAQPQMLDSITIEPNLWPTSGVIDWFNVLNRMKSLPGRTQRIAEIEQILRARLNFQGTVMGFSTQANDGLWWLMISNDVNAVRLVASLVEFGKWAPDMPRLVRGALGRQRQGHWDLTTANAWGTLAMSKFSAAFEKIPVAGASSAAVAGKTAALNWTQKPKGEDFLLEWPAGREDLAVQHSGDGKPWVTIQSLAAIPLKAPLSSGYRITRTVTPVEQREAGRLNTGDILRVRLEIEAQTDMTWVVVSDPIPAGAAILGTGLGRDAGLATSGERSEGWVWPAFEERSFEAFRAYYEYVPKGSWSVEYTLRLNSSGQMSLPPTRVEALYAPELFGEIPNATVLVH
jgi:alpha-2-macroglobulin